MQNELTFYEKSVYGNILTYPTWKISSPFKSLTGNKTASPQQLQALRDLGFTVVVKKLES